MAGYPLTSTDIQNRAGLIVTGVWNALDEANKFYKWLSDTNITGTSDANLTAAGLVSADITLIRNGITDLGSPNGLWGVAHAQKTVTATNDFFFNGKKLTGTYFTG